MKTNSFFKLSAMLIALFFFTSSVQAKIWRINNNAGVVADFSDPNNALSAASDGDTLYFEASYTQYNTLYLYKRLVLVGLGYQLNNTSANYGLQSSSIDARVIIVLYSGATGSKISGLYLRGIGFDASGFDADNITISNCYFENGFNAANASNYRAENWTISKCYVGGPFVASGIKAFNWKFINNIVFNYLVMNNASDSNCLIRNNVIIGSVDVNNVYFANNITYSGSITRVNSTFKNNTSISNSPYQDANDGANGNINAVNESAVFKETGGYTQYDAYFLPTTAFMNSSNTSSDGETVNGVTPKRGPFGTDDPYKPSGIPAIPTIYSISVPASVSSTATSLPVTISTRSNN